MRRLDDSVFAALKERLFSRERLTELLSKLAERRAARSAAVSSRLVNLQAETTIVEQKLKRLYDSIASGIIEIDDLLTERITLLKAEREKAKAALDRAQAQTNPNAHLTAEKVDAFSKLMFKLLADPDTPALKPYLRALIGSVIVDEKTIRIVGSKDVLAGAVTGQFSAVRPPTVCLAKFLNN